MQQRIEWNPTRQLWETEAVDLFSEQQEPFSETWPTSGMTRSGRLLPLPTWAHPTGGNESLLLLTPQSNSTRKGRGAMVHNQQWSAPGLEQVVEMVQGILPREFNSWDEVPGASRQMRRNSPNMSAIADLLPTPVVTDAVGAPGTPQRGALTRTTTSPSGTRSQM